MDFPRQNIHQQVVRLLKLKKAAFTEAVGDNMYEIRPDPKVSGATQAKRKQSKGRYTSFATKSFFSQSCQICSTTFDNSFEAINCAWNHCHYNHSLGESCAFNCGADRHNMHRHIPTHLMGCSIYVCMGCGVTNRRVDEMELHCAECKEQRSTTHLRYMSMLDVEFLWLIGAPSFSEYAVAAFLTSKHLWNSHNFTEQTVQEMMNKFIVAVPRPSNTRKLKRSLNNEDVEQVMQPQQSESKRIRCFERQVIEFPEEVVEDPMQELLEISILTETDQNEDKDKFETNADLNVSLIDCCLNAKLELSEIISGGLDLNLSMNQDSSEDPFEAALNSSLNLSDIVSEVDDFTDGNSSDFGTDYTDGESVNISQEQLDEAIEAIAALKPVLIDDDIHVSLSSIPDLVDESDDDSSSISSPPQSTFIQDNPEFRRRCSVEISKVHTENLLDSRILLQLTSAFCDVDFDDLNQFQISL